VGKVPGGAGESPGIPFDSIPTHYAYAALAARLQSDLFDGAKLTFRLKSAELTFSINIYLILSGSIRKYKIFPTLLAAI